MISKKVLRSYSINRENVPLSQWDYLTHGDSAPDMPYTEPSTAYGQSQDLHAGKGRPLMSLLPSKQPKVRRLQSTSGVFCTKNTKSHCVSGTVQAPKEMWRGRWWTSWPRDPQAPHWLLYTQSSSGGLSQGTDDSECGRNDRVNQM